MTKEEKELLLRDLCARLPYGIQCEIGGLRHGPYTFGAAPGDIEDLMEGREFKPYLRPMSSMAEEEKKEYTSYCFEQPFLQKDKTPNLGSVPMCIDWLLANHFDYRGLIPMGLALEATEEMYKEE